MSGDAKPVCGAPCCHGGKSAARKHSRSDLGWMGHCNRPVSRSGRRCWQHPLATRSADAECCLYERSDKARDDYCRTNCLGFVPGFGGAA